MRKVSWILSAVAMTAFVSSAAAQEKAPAPAPASKGAVIVQPAPHGYAAPNYHYQPDCCDHGGRGGHGGGWGAGLDLLIVKPHFDHGNDENLGFINEEDEEPAGQMENKWDFSISPRVWVSYVNCDGMGGRIRYWRFDDDADDLRTGVEGRGNLLTAELELDSVDIEALYQVELSGITLTASGGLRYARTEMNRTRLDEDDEFLESNVEVSGFGPTLAIEARSGGGEGLGFFAGTRTSILFGTTELFALKDENNDGDLEFVGTMEERDDVFWVLELSLGADYTCCYGDCLVSLRVAAEAQLWGGASFDGLVFAGGFPDPRPSFNAVTARNTADGNLAFGGLTIGLAISR